MLFCLGFYQLNAVSYIFSHLLQEYRIQTRNCNVYLSDFYSHQLLLYFAGLLNIFVTPSQATAVYGVSSYQIRCYVTGAPGATNWYWTKTPLNGGPPITLSRTTDNAHYKIEQSATQPHLTIFGITEADEADYVCYAGNGAGLRSSTTSRLEVTGGER